MWAVNSSDMRATVWQTMPSTMDRQRSTWHKYKVRYSTYQLRNCGTFQHIARLFNEWTTLSTAAALRTRSEMRQICKYTPSKNGLRGYELLPSAQRNVMNVWTIRRRVLTISRYCFRSPSDVCEKPSWTHDDRYRRHDPSVLLYVLQGSTNTVRRILLINRFTRIYKYLPPHSAT
jgi:hypothetical protein